MKKIIIFLVLSTTALFAGIGFTSPPPCGFFSWSFINNFFSRTGPELPDFTMFGDSRARLAADIHYLSNFSNATKDGISLIRPNQIRTIQNIGWAGSTASDNQRDLFEWLNGYLTQTPGKYKEMTWWRRWDSCKASGVSYVTHPKTVMNLGGNDMVNFEKYYANRDGLLGPLTIILNPASLLGIFGKPKSPLEKEFRWNWAFHAKEEIILLHMTSIVKRLLNQSSHLWRMTIDRVGGREQ